MGYIGKEEERHEGRSGSFLQACSLLGLSWAQAPVAPSSVRGWATCMGRGRAQGSGCCPALSLHRSPSTEGVSSDPKTLRSNSWEIVHGLSGYCSFPGP